MKYMNKIALLLVIAVAMMTSCVDDAQLGYEVEKPSSIEEMEYLNAYDALKTYVNRSASPDFILGAGVTLSDYTAGGLMYRLVTSNFDEITIGYDMKHGAVVQANGNLNLANVSALLQAAKKADITVYGHTLCWHANQNAKYLNSLLEPIIIPGTGGPSLDPSVITNSDFETDASGWAGWGNSSTRGRTVSSEGYNGGYGYFFTNPSATNSWSVQVAYDFTTALEVGATYVLNFKVKATQSGSISAGIQNPTSYASCGEFGSFNLTTGWTDITLETNITGENAKRFLFNFGNFVGTIYIDDITLRRRNPSGGSGSGTDVIADFEADALGKTYPMTSNGSATVVTDPAGESGKVLNIICNQSFPQFTVTLPSGRTLGNYKTLTLDFRGTGSTGLYGQGMRMSINGGTLSAFDSPSTYGCTDGAWGRGKIIMQLSTLNLTAEQKKLTSFTIELGSATGAGNYFIDNITMQWETTGDQTIEKTPEEKTEIIAGELERWMKGMLEASKDYVKAWDVVNEPMSDWPDPSQLKSGIGRTDLATDIFYWQDYLGKDYAVKAIQLARQYGNSDDKLFINDYGLESNLDKCRGLIEYVNYVESKGVRVDGIGTQMHISLNVDKDKIVEMFTLLAATGKLIKISELDLGIATGVTASNATKEQYQAQAELYKYVIKKYFELIPASQRYGITVWCPLDSKTGSSWRPGEPVGLWTEVYVRKQAYAGFADGLAGK